MGVASREIKANFRFINHIATATGGEKKTGARNPHTLSPSGADCVKGGYCYARAVAATCANSASSYCVCLETDNGAYDWCCSIRDWQCHYRRVCATLSVPYAVCVRACWWCMHMTSNKINNHNNSNTGWGTPASEASRKKKLKMKGSEAAERSWEKMENQVK